VKSRRLDGFYAVDVRYPDEFYTPTLRGSEGMLLTLRKLKLKEFIFKKLNITERDIL
jgi:hypothetical protein